MRLTKWYHVEENRARKIAKIVEQENGRIYNYILAEEYARLTAECNVSETDARKYSGILEKEIKWKELFTYMGERIKIKLDNC